MKVYSKENINKKYIVVELDKEQDSYEMKMLESNRIGAMCPYSIRDIDDKKYIYYDISDKVSMEEKADNTKFQINAIGKIINGIKSAKYELVTYMIDGDKIALNPKYIFFDREDENIYFCYIPYKEKNMQASLIELSNYIIANADHNDRETVIRAYGLQQFVNTNDKVTIEETADYFFGRKDTGYELHTYEEEKSTCCDEDEYGFGDGLQNEAVEECMTNDRESEWEDSAHSKSKFSSWIERYSGKKTDIQQ